MSEDKRDPRTIETASGTTSPDNSNSGGMAYIIFFATFALLLVISLASGGCTAAVMASVADEASTSYTYPQNYYNFEDYDVDDWENWLREYEEMYGTQGEGYTDSTENDRSGSADVEEVLGYIIAPIYGVTIDSEVGASSYAGAPNSVRDFVRALVKTDEDYSNQISSLLNQASYDEAIRSDNIKQALALCDEAKAAIESMELPAIENDTDGEVADLLGSAKKDAAKRWTLMHDEITILDTTEQIEKKSLWNVDDEVVSATESAAETLEDALERSANLK